MTSRPHRPPARVPVGILSRQHASTVQQNQCPPVNPARQTSTLFDLTSDPEQPSRREGPALIRPQPQSVSVALEKDSPGGQDLVSGEEADRTSQAKGLREVSHDGDGSRRSPTAAEQSPKVCQPNKIPLPSRPGSFLRDARSQLGAESPPASAEEEKEDVPRTYKLQPPAVATRLPDHSKYTNARTANRQVNGRRSRRLLSLDRQSPRGHTLRSSDKGRILRQQGQHHE